MQRQNYTPAALPGTRWLQGAAGAANLVGTVVMGGMAPIPGNGDFQLAAGEACKRVSIYPNTKRELQDTRPTSHVTHHKMYIPHSSRPNRVPVNSTPFTGNLQNAL